MNRKRLGFLLTMFGLVLALFVGALVYLQVAEANQVRQALPKRQVVVATADIPEQTEVSAGTLALVLVPDEAIPPGAATKIEDVAGKFTPQRIYRGEVVNLDRLGPASLRNTPSFEIEKGKVMYIFPAQLQTSLGPGGPFSVNSANALRPGDHVDILYSAIVIPQDLPRADREEARQLYAVNYLQTRVVLQNLRVHHVGTFGERPTTGGGGSGAQTVPPEQKYIAFVVSPEEALVLKWIRDAALLVGNIEFALRAPGDNEIGDPGTINLNYMREKYGLTK